MDIADFTTNTHDLQEAANLQARLSEYNEQHQAAASATNSTNDDAIPAVALDSGAYKYVLITAKTPTANRIRTFVYSKRNAQYHRNVAERLLPILESNGFRDIKINGGGRILRDDEDKKVHIFGYSYGFGRADHALAKEVVEQSVNYRGYTVTW